MSSPSVLTSATRRRGRAKARAPKGRVVSIASALAFLAIAVGWWNRDDTDLIASEGLGYLLGIVGLTLMTVLLGYSARKRLRVLRNAGRVSAWFQIHMMLGLFGPVAILYHCNFSLGSLNSNVSLACALVVAGSGVLGRVIYTRIHYGLSDRRRTLEELRDQLADSRQDVGGGDSVAFVHDALRELESRVIGAGTGLLRSFWTYLTVGHHCRRALRRTRRRLRADVRSGGLRADQRSAHERAVKRHVGTIREVGSLAAYERIFALWHVLHLPLCFLLFVSAAVHVIAVHIY